jgi:putative two-component system response regulator
MSKTGRVLVADDHEPTLLGMRDLLEAAGHVVYTASTGCEALRAATAKRPDVILLDVMMPGMTGTNVCDELKRAPETRLTPVVLISGSGDRGTRLGGLEAGADDFLNKPVDPEELRVRIASAIRLKRLTDDLDSAESLFLTLGRIVEARDPYTEGHCERLAHYATALGSSLKLTATELDALYRGAFLHDIGKIGIPDRILLRKGKLGRRDYELMKQHPVIGDALCATLRSLDAVRPIVRHHHERLDGRGYPDGLKGEAVPLLAQIVSVVDVFDALTTDRPYRKALRADAAYRILLDQARDGWCAEHLVQRFIDLHRSGLRSARRADDGAPDDRSTLRSSDQSPAPPLN